MMNMPTHTVKMQNRYAQALYLSMGYSDFGRLVWGQVDVGAGNLDIVQTTKNYQKLPNW